jgi:drug/metabolite transporter (DMT)-like permease
MKHTLTPQRYLILLAVMLTASVGDTLLSHGMKQVGPVSFSHLGLLLAAMRNPWVIAGILCLLGFFASYLTALSWADLTFVLPSTAFGYVVVALLSKFWLHETISSIAGPESCLSSAAWASSPTAHLTEHRPNRSLPRARSHDRRANITSRRAG